MYLTRRLLRHRLKSGDEVWLNALTGAADRLSRPEVMQVLKALKGGKNQPQAVLDKLWSRGYLYADQKAEADAFNRLVQNHLPATAANQSVKHLIICPTYSCDLRCVYCFERSSEKTLPRKRMSAEAVEKVMAAFSEIRRQEPQRSYMIGLFGGEPLLPANRKIVERTLQEAQAESLPVMIVTNGFNMAGYLPLLKKYRAVIDGIQVTLDGPEQVHNRRRPAANGKGTFLAVATAAGNLLKIGVTTVLRVNIDRSNVQFLPELTQIIKNRGWDQNELFKCCLAPVKDHSGTGQVPNVTPEGELLSALFDVYDIDPESEKLFGLEGIQVLGPIVNIIKSGGPARPKVYNCEANHGDFCVAGPDGYLYACPEAIGQQRLAVGSYDPEFKIWPEQLGKWTSRNISSQEKCRKCEIAPLCGGGCAYASLIQFPDSALPVCEQDLRGAMEVFLDRRVV